MDAANSRDINEIYIRQEAHIALTNALADRVEALSEQFAQLLEWANRPADSGLQDSMDQLTAAIQALAPPPATPGSDLGPLIRNLTVALQALQTQVVQHGAALRDLPDAVARAVRR